MIKKLCPLSLWRHRLDKDDIPASVCIEAECAWWIEIKEPGTGVIVGKCGFTLIFEIAADGKEKGHEK